MTLPARFGFCGWSCGLQVWPRSAVDKGWSCNRRFVLRNSSPQTKKCQRYEVLHRASEWADCWKDEMAMTVFNWLRIGTGDGLLWTRLWTLGLFLWEISVLTEEQSGYQEKKKGYALWSYFISGSTWFGHAVGMTCRLAAFRSCAAGHWIFLAGRGLTSLAVSFRPTGSYLLTPRT